LFSQLKFVFGFLDVRPIELLDVVAVESCLHGPYSAEELAHFGEVMRLEDAGMRGGIIGVDREDIPRAKDEVLQ
jgi:hypothetical protein